MCWCLAGISLAYTLYVLSKLQSKSYLTTQQLSNGELKMYMSVRFYRLDLSDVASQHICLQQEGMLFAEWEYAKQCTMNTFSNPNICFSPLPWCKNSYLLTVLADAILSNWTRNTSSQNDACRVGKTSFHAAYNKNLMVLHVSVLQLESCQQSRAQYVKKSDLPPAFAWGGKWEAKHALELLKIRTSSASCRACFLSQDWNTLVCTTRERTRIHHTESHARITLSISILRTPILILNASQSLIRYPQERDH